MRIIRFFIKWMPLALVVGIPLILAAVNMDPGTHYAGWDNILAEFDYWRYARQVVGGAWLTYSGLGNPAGLAHLAEIPRLPILWVLTTILPSNMVRYVFIFGMLLTGSVGMYVYLCRIWLRRVQVETHQKWIASIGAILYVLHILTIQQFYIAFELFTVQFAFFPFLLLSIHQLVERKNARSLLVFIFVQFLITPSGHTPTVFYLGALFSIVYAYCISVRSGIRHALKQCFIVGALTIFLSSYWIVPNVYYTLDGSQAVKESRENTIFGPEALWSVHDAATVSNFLSGTHYLFSWNQYSFSKGEFAPILGVWNEHMKLPSVLILAQFIGLLTLVGGMLLVIDTKKGPIRWAIVVSYFGSTLLIWMGFFPHRLIIDQILASKLLLEVFRNPFTKLSILYGFVSILFFTYTLELIINFICQPRAKNRWTQIHCKITSAFIYIFVISMICIVALPAFQGYYINPQLKIVFPPVYQKMFEYLKTRSSHLRAMQLPQFQYVGWEYYDWTNIKNGNGYSGMGFYQFGMDQPYLLRDSDRWGETSDFFGHELKYALDNQNGNLLLSVLKKYNIDLVIIDESKIDPLHAHDYSRDHILLSEIGLSKVWQQSFLSIYERSSSHSDSGVLYPQEIHNVGIDTRRARIDTAYLQNGDYINRSDDTQATQYPFADITKRQLSNIQISGDTVDIVRKVPKGRYTLSFPKQEYLKYSTPIKISYKDKNITVQFPDNHLYFGDQVLISENTSSPGFREYI